MLRSRKKQLNKAQKKVTGYESVTFFSRETRLASMSRTYSKYEK